MNKDINIADILRGCQKGMKLYSPVCGECRLEKAYENGEFIRCTMPKAKDTRIKFNAYGKVVCEGSVDDDAETLLFLSASMRDWSKFFKRGDVVYNPSSQMYAIFNGWVDDTYTHFNTTFNLYSDGTVGKGIVCKTKSFEKVNAKTRKYSSVIQYIENFCGIKLNTVTLVVEPIKERHEFMPFDRVLARENDHEIWHAEFFSHFSADTSEYVCIGGAYDQCIPYNKKTAHLIGMSENYEKGEKE